jgi:hypothetical protein
MRSFQSWPLRPPAPPTANKWSYRLLVCTLSLGLLALAAGVAISELHPGAPATVASSYSGGGNLIPVF